MRNFKFYAVTGNDGIVSLKHSEYGSVKAIFWDEKDAQKCVDKNPDKGLKVEAVKIVAEPTK